MIECTNVIAMVTLTYAISFIWGTIRCKQHCWLACNQYQVRCILITMLYLLLNRLQHAKVSFPQCRSTPAVLIA